MHIAIYDDKHTLSQHTAEYIMRIAKESINLHGRFTFALTGGTTPGEVYNLLGSEPIRSQIDWQLVHIFWGDERCVPHNNPESNFHLAQEVLLDNIAIPKSQIHPVPADQLDRDAASQAYSVEMQHAFGTNGIPSFDLIHLGMGPEGHTASLFPHQHRLYAQQTERSYGCWTRRLHRNYMLTIQCKRGNYHNGNWNRTLYSIRRLYSFG